MSTVPGPVSTARAPITTTFAPVTTARGPMIAVLAAITTAHTAITTARVQDSLDRARKRGDILACMGKTSTTGKKAAAKMGAARTPLATAMAALAEGDVGKVPPYTTQRLPHLEALARAATRDGADLCRVPLEDGALRPEDLALFAAAVEAAAREGAAVDADRAANGGLTPADAKFLAGVRADQKLVLRAFRHLRFKRRPAERKRLAAIERGADDDADDARRDSTALLALADHDDHRAWVASLPKGEGDAVARLRAAQDRLAALALAAGMPATVAARRDAHRRVWTLLIALDRRIREAGRYLYGGTARAKDYAAFKTRGRAKTAGR